MSRQDKFSSESIMPKKLYNGHSLSSTNAKLVDKKTTREMIKYIDYKNMKWHNIINIFLIHVLSVIGVYLAFVSAKWNTLFFTALLLIYSGIGVTMGAHRLWAHRSFKAKNSLRIFLAVAQTLSMQNSIYHWTRDHRAHHKYSETDADPHNSNRGFFFCHMGWLMVRKHTEVKEKGKSIDLSDLLEDPVVKFQKKYYYALAGLISVAIPSLAPWYIWNESLFNSLCICVFTRYVLSLHATWSVNSLAHWVGYKPYDESISPAQNLLVSFFTLGEGWHNYHHVFPYDYRASEFPGIIGCNFTTIFINFCEKLNLAYDLKVVPDEVIGNRKIRTGYQENKFSKYERKFTD